MSSLVEELQREALDAKVAVSDLLRKALVVATKLNLRKFRWWVEKELDGFIGCEVPTYRTIMGAVKAFNPYRGYIPFICADAELTRLISTHPERSPIGTLQELIERGESEYVYNFPPELQNLLMQEQEFPMLPTLHISRSAYIRILESVRNEVLRWSLKLEGDGIIGEGMSFSQEEKATASAKADDLAPSINITVIGTMANSAVQQGSSGSRQEQP
jgi:hypothetical protein